MEKRKSKIKIGINRKKELKTKKAKNLKKEKRNQKN